MDVLRKLVFRAFWISNACCYALQTAAQELSLMILSQGAGHYKYWSMHAHNLGTQLFCTLLVPLCSLLIEDLKCDHGMLKGMLHTNSCLNAKVACADARELMHVRHWS